MISNEAKMMVCRCMTLPQNSEFLLDTVSTTCGSGWVRQPSDIATRLRTHPLPQVVLTVSNNNFGLYSKAVHVDHRFGEGLRCFLWQIVSDATSDEPVFVFAREFLRIYGRVWMRCAIGITFKCNRWRRNHRSLSKPPFKIIVLSLSFGQAAPPQQSCRCRKASRATKLPDGHWLDQLPHSLRSIDQHRFVLPDRTRCLPADCSQQSCLYWILRELQRE